MEEQTIKKAGGKGLVIGLIAAAVVILAVVIGIVAYSNSPGQRYKKQIALAEKYLSELDYDNAIAAYKLALDIDPKSPKAYEELAKIYISRGEDELALEVLRKGVEQTGDETLKKMLEETEKRIEEAKQAEEIPEDGEEEEKKEEEAIPEGGYGWNGEYVVFGRYDQDNNLLNGEEPIEWEVLEEDDEKMLLVSRFILDCQAYNGEKKDITWEFCSLRDWLNGSFYDSAFDAKEKRRILVTELSNPSNAFFGPDRIPENPPEGTPGGNNTKDKVFILSVEELLKYYTFEKYYEEKGYGYSDSLIVDGTIRAKTGGKILNTITKEYYEGFGYAEDGIEESVIGNTYYTWWVRSPGGYGYTAVIVFPLGRCGWNGQTDVSSTKGVRPAICIRK